MRNADRAKFIVKDLEMNHAPRVVEGLKKGYVDENQILVMFDHAVRARILQEGGVNVDSMQLLQDWIHDWGEQTFVGQTAKSKLKGCAREINKELLKNMGSIKEWADVLIYFLGAARKAGIRVADLVEAGNAKMYVNVKRKWGKPDRHGVYHHTCNRE